MTFKSSAELRQKVELPFHGQTISFESGWVAKQADGSVIVRSGDTMILCTVCTADARPDQSFFPLVCEYQEKGYSAGKIPGGFFKREGRPGEHEILTCRLIDRPIRPLFPDGFMDEVQIICTVISVDEENEPYTLAICGASAALHVSGLPFMGPIAGVKVGRVDGELVCNPSPAQLANSDIELVVAGTDESLVMVEGGAQVVPEQDIIDALYFGHEQIRKLIAAQEDLRKLVGKEKKEFVPAEKNGSLIEKVTSLAGSKIEKALEISQKQARKEAISEIRSEAKETLAEEYPESEDEISEAFSKLIKQASRKQIIETNSRLDNRAPDEIRPIECEVGILPRTHGSALFTRGETQAIVTSTLGTAADAQRIDNIVAQDDKHFMLHYNFPPYCTGEVKMMRGTARREVGHGALAERALRPAIPKKDFPYVVRIVSDVTESNGSSSMASVCGGSLSLMDAGVSIKDAVAGVAMGLIKEGEEVRILSDILGDEDHFGDMDFKVCGTKEGITALQMDIKCTGLSREIMERALAQAKDGRLHILSKMAEAISEPRSNMSEYAPSIQTISINPDKIKDVIGPGGKTIRSIVETTGVKIDIENDGTVLIASNDQEASRRAIEIINGLTEEAEIGKIYCGVVKRIADFGAFVEILPGIEGLVHISQLEDKHVKNVTDIVKEGEEVMVRVLDIDRQGRVRLSRKDAMQAQEEANA